jgi:hypothetical protein
MRADLHFTGRILGLALGALAFGGLVVASCSFSPGEPGSGLGPTGTSTGTGSTGTSTGSGNPFGGSSGSTAGTAGNGGSVNPDGATCGGQKYNAQNVPPDLLILLDKSGSMDEQADGTQCPGMGMPCPTQKWPQMVMGLNSVVGASADKINWGLAYFPSSGGSSSCTTAANAAVAIAPNNAGPIMASLAATETDGRTPTRSAVNNAVTYLQTLTSPNPKFILLATDGAPNCMPGAGQSTASDAAGAVQAVSTAAMMGIPVFVVGIGNVAEFVQTLNDMAVAGGRPAAGATKYYPASSSADLVAVLTTIGAQIATCTFTLSAVPPVPGNIAVYGDGAKIPASATDGWSYGTGMRSVILNGPTCDKVKAGTIKDVQTYFGCPGEVIP